MQVIEELCGVCGDLARIIQKQQAALAQHQALCMEDEINRARASFVAMIGRDEWPDDLPEGDCSDVC